MEQRNVVPEHDYPGNVLSLYDILAKRGQIFPQEEGGPATGKVEDLLVASKLAEKLGVFSPEEQVIIDDLAKAEIPEEYDGNLGTSYVIEGEGAERVIKLQEIELKEQK